MNSSMLVGERRWASARRGGMTVGESVCSETNKLAEPTSMYSLAKSIASNSRMFWGWLFLIVGSLSFMGFLYAAVISKIQPPSHNVIIRAIQNDWYYCFLVPLTVPILFVAVYFHWLSMKLFKHA